MLTTCAVATFAGLTAAACGGGAPAPDTSAGTSPTAGDSVTTAPASMTEGGASQPAAEAGAEGRATPPSTPPSAGTSREPRAPSLKPDTVRGIVTEVGSYPMTSVVVQPASGGEPVVAFRTYAPAKNQGGFKGFLNQLTLHLSIGEAF